MTRGFAAQELHRPRFCCASAALSSSSQHNRLRAQCTTGAPNVPWLDLAHCPIKRRLTNTLVVVSCGASRHSTARQPLFKRWLGPSLNHRLKFSKAFERVQKQRATRWICRGVPGVVDRVSDSVRQKTKRKHCQLRICADNLGGRLVGRLRMCQID